MTSPPRGGQFSVSVTGLVCDLLTRTGISVRTVAATLALIVQRWDLRIRTPSATTIRWWILRLGCYSLICPLPKDKVWVWLIDHTLQIGSLKLFVIVGCPLEDVPFGERNLRLEDLRLIALVPMTQATHEMVDAELEKATVRTGIPRLITSDQGNELVKGIANY